MSSSLAYTDSTHASCDAGCIIGVVFVSFFGGLVYLMITSAFVYLTCCSYDSRFPRRRALCCPRDAAKQGRDQIVICG